MANIAKSAKLQPLQYIMTVRMPAGADSYFYPLL
jgi:hypothetical protein